MPPAYRPDTDTGRNVLDDRAMPDPIARDQVGGVVVLILREDLHPNRKIAQDVHHLLAIGILVDPGGRSWRDCIR